MTLESVGLTTRWNLEFYPAPERCLNWNPPLGLTKLSLRGLSGAFLVLGVGYALAFAVFIMERLIHWRNGWKRNEMLVAE